MQRCQTPVMSFWEKFPPVWYHSRRLLFTQILAICFAGLLMMKENLESSESLRQNKSMVVDLPRSSRMLHHAASKVYTADKLQNSMQGAFSLLGDNAWPSWKVRMRIDYNPLPSWKTQQRDTTFALITFTMWADSDDRGRWGKPGQGPPETSLGPRPLQDKAKKMLMRYWPRFITLIYTLHNFNFENERDIPPTYIIHEWKIFVVQRWWILCPWFGIPLI